MDIYQPYGANIQVDGGSLVSVGGVTDQNIDTNPQITAEVTAGLDTPQHSEITSIASQGSFTGFDIGKILQAIGLTGDCLNGGASAGFELFQLKLEECGSLASGSVHRKLVMPNGYIVPRTLDVGHRQNGTLVTEVLGISDGTNNQVIPVDNIAAPTGLEDLSRYTLGEMTVGGINLLGNLSLNIDFGVDVQTDGGDSDTEDTNIQVISKQPMINITTRDVSKFKTSGGIPSSGLRATHANSSIVLRKRQNGTSGFMTGPNHIRFTFDGLVTVNQPWRASGNTRGEMSLQVKCLDDGTNYPIVPDYAYDLSA